MTSQTLTQETIKAVKAKIASAYSVDKLRSVASNVNDLALYAKTETEIQVMIKLVDHLAQQKEVVDNIKKLAEEGAMDEDPKLYSKEDLQNAINTNSFTSEMRQDVAILSFIIGQLCEYSVLLEKIPSGVETRLWWVIDDNAKAKFNTKYTAYQNSLMLATISLRGAIATLETNAIELKLENEIKMLKERKAAQGAEMLIASLDVKLADRNTETAKGTPFSPRKTQETTTDDITNALKSTKPLDLRSIETPGGNVTLTDTTVMEDIMKMQAEEIKRLKEQMETKKEGKTDSPQMSSATEFVKLGEAPATVNKVSLEDLEEERTPFNPVQKVNTPIPRKPNMPIQNEQQQKDSVDSKQAQTQVNTLVPIFKRPDRSSKSVSINDLLASTPIIKAETIEGEIPADSEENNKAFIKLMEEYNSRVLILNSPATDIVIDMKGGREHLMLNLRTKSIEKNVTVPGDHILVKINNLPVNFRNDYVVVTPDSRADLRSLFTEIIDDKHALAAFTGSILKRSGDKILIAPAKIGDYVIPGYFQNACMVTVGETKNRVTMRGSTIARQMIASKARIEQATSNKIGKKGALVPHRGVLIEFGLLMTEGKEKAAVANARFIIQTYNLLPLYIAYGNGIIFQGLDLESQKHLLRAMSSKFFIRYMNPEIAPIIPCTERSATIIEGKYKNKAELIERTDNWAKQFGMGDFAKVVDLKARVKNRTGKPKFGLATYNFR